MANSVNSYLGNSSVASCLYARMDAESQALRDQLRAWMQYLVAAHHHSQADAARMIGVRPPTISQILSGKKPMGLDMVWRLQHRYGAFATQLLSGPPPKAGRANKQTVDPPAHHAVARHGSSR